MLRTLSGLTTRGRCLFSAGVAAAICAVILDERDLLRIAIFGAALPVIVAIFTRRAHVHVSASREIAPDQVPVGSAANVHLRLSKKGLLPSGEITLADSARSPLNLVARFSLTRLPYQDTVSLRYSLPARRRGIYQVGPLTARVTDLFGLCEYERQLAGNTRLTVVPQVFALAKTPEKAGSITENDNSYHLQSGQGEPDTIVRQYRQGDDLRKVHWRSTARRDELMVRQDEHPWHGGCAVLLDHRAHAHRGEQSGSLEWAVSFAASVCSHIRRGGHNIRLISHNGESIVDSHGVESAFTHRMLGTLAALTASDNADLHLDRDPAPGEDFIAILGATELQQINALARCRPTGSQSRAVLMDVASWSSPGAALKTGPESASESGPEQEQLRACAQLLQSLGWAVTVVTARVSVTEAWSGLSSRDRRSTPPETWL